MGLMLTKLALGYRSRSAISAFIVAGLLTGPLCSRANALDPVTVYAGTTLASTLLKTGSNADVTGAVAQAQLDMLLAIHSRLDKIETSLSDVMLQIAELPTVMRDLLSQDSDIDQSELTIGILETITQRLSLLRQRGAKGVVDDAELDKALLDLKSARNTLLHRTDNVAPTFVRALVTEIIASTTAGKPPDEIGQLLAVYDHRFQEILDADRKGSLAWGLEELVRLQQNDEAVIAATLGFHSGKIQSGIVHWYLSPVNFNGAYGTSRGGNDFGWDHDRIWQRRIDVRTMDQEYSAFHIAISPVGPYDPGMTSKRRLRPSIATKLESSKIQENSRLQNEAVAVFNARANAIRVVADTIRLASLARRVIADWSEAEAGRLGAAAQSMSTNGVGDALFSAEQAQREMRAKSLIRDMNETRLQAWARIEESIKKIDAASAQARKEKWKGQAIVLLDVIGASAQMASAINAEVASAKLRAAASLTASINAGLDGQDVSTAGPDAAKEVPIDEKPRHESRSGGEGPLKGIEDMTSIEKVSRVRELLREIRDAPPTSYGETLPDDFTPAELKAFQALAILDGMTMPEADRFRSEHAKSVADVIGDALQEGILSLSPQEGLMSITKDASVPTIMGNGDLDSAIEQNSLRAAVNAELARFAAIRAPKFDLRTFIQLQMEEAERCANGCIENLH
jgi:hypothetical protein